MGTDSEPKVIAPKTDVSGPVLDFIESLHGPTGKILKAAHKLGGVRLIYALVVQPLLFALLAAFWMLLLGGIQWAPVKAVRESLVTLIHAGFSVDKATEATSVRDAKVIDFVQVIEFDLSPKHPEKRIPIPLHADQTVRVNLHLNAAESACFNAKPKAVELVVYLKDSRATIDSISSDRESYDRFAWMDSKWWESHVRFLDIDPDRADKPVVGDLVLKRSDANDSSDSCASVSGHLQVSAFKTNYRPTSSERSPSKKGTP